MKPKLILLYFLIFFSAFFCFIFLLFPQKEFAAFVSRSLENQISALHISIGNIKPAIPFSLKFDNVNMLLGPHTQILSESLKLSLSPASLFKQDTIHGTVAIHNASAKIENPLFNMLNLPMVEFSDIELEFTQKLKTITVTQCMANGSDINFTLEGNINMALPLQESRLNLTGFILPDSPYIKTLADKFSTDGIKFFIKGTLNNPNITI